MTLEILDITVPGRPALLTSASAAAEAWKNAVALAAAAGGADGYLRNPCAVELVFRLEPAVFPSTALFNLLKATVDGLSNVLFAPANPRRPADWHREDWLITDLRAYKMVSYAVQGVRIRVVATNTTPHDAAAHDSEGAIAFVRGDPPPWPGDANGARRVRIWRGLLEQQLRSTAFDVQSTPSTLALAIDFHLAKDRVHTTDLDNLCVPACQAVQTLLFGQSRKQPLVALVARKLEGRTANEVGTTVRIKAPAVHVPLA